MERLPNSGRAEPSLAMARYVECAYPLVLRPARVWPGRILLLVVRPAITARRSSVGLLWIAGWLFTIGYGGLSFWQGALAIIVWPYFLGVDLAAHTEHLP